jgi:hypothetical protein
MKERLTLNRKEQNRVIELNRVETTQILEQSAGNHRIMIRSKIHQSLFHALALTDLEKIEPILRLVETGRLALARTSIIVLAGTHGVVSNQYYSQPLL